MNLPFPRRRPMPRHALAGSLLAATAAFAACTAPSRPAAPSPPPAAPPADPAIATEGTATVRWSDLRDAMAEVAGGIALEEHLLDRAIAMEAIRRGVAADGEAIDAERGLLRASLAEDPDRAEELLQRIRDRQGLGPRRFEALLRRNALLRAMVSDEVEIDAAALERIHDVRHGPRRRSRLLAAASLPDASAAAARLERGETFAAIAFDASLDPSRDAGGLLPPISRLDPAWPAAFRETLFATPVGGVSPPVLADRHWLLVEVLEEIPGDGTDPDAVREELRRLARLQQERVLMDRLARALASPLTPRILDPAIGASWQMLRRAAGR